MIIWTEWVPGESRLHRVMSQKNKSKKMFNKHLKMYTLKAIDVVFKTQKKQLSNYI